MSTFSQRNIYLILIDSCLKKKTMHAIILLMKENPVHILACLPVICANAQLYESVFIWGFLGRAGVRKTLVSSASLPSFQDGTPRNKRHMRKPRFRV